ncbi:MAG: beta-phosphoglucomutase-like phosphatase (HAD superfamily) [Verrucomicrobiales bacterium]|jgi:beta-phosphoglucomutase-like phosphatase (HAD superfamily)
MSDELIIPAGEFEGYIFDHDGTLSLSMHVHFDGWIHSYAKNGGDFVLTRELAQSYAGVGMHETVEIMNERFGCSMDPQQVVVDQEDYYLANLDRVISYDPVVDFAKRVSTTHPVSVASGGTRDTVSRTMQAIGIFDLFPVIVTQEDVERSKPAPDIFLLAAEKMGIAAEKCLVFEDSHLGIQAADAAGMASVLVTPADPA